MWIKPLICLSVISIAGCTVFSTRDAAPVVASDGSYSGVVPRANARSHFHGKPSKNVPIISESHTVQAGESLYEIAWRYGQDYREIASSNHISSPYVIYPGQKLHLKPTLSHKSRFALFHPQDKPKPNRAQSQLALGVESAPKMLNQIAWIWPVKGTIVKSFSAGVGPKGIDIAGALGKPVVASAAGKVVYSGSGLRGYGQLVIIKHNDIFLSAYAHNNELLVKEGQMVTQGQTIAHMGKSDSDEIKLHFEIRKNGQPINPLPMLPAA